MINKFQINWARLASLDPEYTFFKPPGMGNLNKCTFASDDYHCSSCQLISYIAQHDLLACYDTY